jgi:hypothetical protein
LLQRSRYLDEARPTADDGLVLIAFTAQPGSASADALNMPASWASPRTKLPTPTNAARAERSRGDGQSYPGRTEGLASVLTYRNPEARDVRGDTLRPHTAAVVKSNAVTPGDDDFLVRALALVESSVLSLDLESAAG